MRSGHAIDLGDPIADVQPSGNGLASRNRRRTRHSPIQEPRASQQDRFCAHKGFSNEEIHRFVRRATGRAQGAERRPSWRGTTPTRLTRG
jgi:hypothetical protein